MAIQVASELKPRDGNAYAVADEQYVRGGYRTVATLTERNNLDPDVLKVGMLVYVSGNGSTYRLESLDPIDWQAYSTGGSGVTGADLVDQRFGQLVQKYRVNRQSNQISYGMSANRIQGVNCPYTYDGEVFVVQHPGHTVEVGQLPIIRTHQGKQLDFVCVAADENTFTVQPTNFSGAASGTVVYTKGCRWINYQNDGVTPAVGSNDIRLGRAHCPADADIVIMSLRLRFAINTRIDTIYGICFDGGDIGNGAYDQGSTYDSMFMPFIYGRTEGPTSPGAPGTMSATAINPNSFYLDDFRNFRISGMAAIASPAMLQVIF